VSRDFLPKKFREEFFLLPPVFLPKYAGNEWYQFEQVLRNKAGFRTAENLPARRSGSGRWVYQNKSNGAFFTVFAKQYNGTFEIGVKQKRF
jgi:hypothetical protein